MFGSINVGGEGSELTSHGVWLLAVNAESGVQHDRSRANGEGRTKTEMKNEKCEAG